MIYGPCDYFPPVEVEVVEKRRSIPLDENEGIYVRDNKTGKVRAVIGTTYMLKANEELWEKTLNPVVEQLLQKEVYAERANNTKASDKPGDILVIKHVLLLIVFPTMLQFKFTIIKRKLLVLSLALIL